jgi:hypothetical protein
MCISHVKKHMSLLYTRLKKIPLIQFDEKLCPKIIRLHNKIKNEFLIDSSILYIEREIITKFNTNSIIDDFHNLKRRIR